MLASYTIFMVTALIIISLFLSSLRSRGAEVSKRTGGLEAGRWPNISSISSKKLFVLYLSLHLPPCTPFWDFRFCDMAAVGLLRLMGTPQQHHSFTVRSGWGSSSLTLVLLLPIMKKQLLSHDSLYKDICSLSSKGLWHPCLGPSKKLIQLRFAKKVFYYSCPQVVKDAGCCWW